MNDPLLTAIAKKIQLAWAIMMIAFVSVVGFVISFGIANGAEIAPGL